MRIKLNQSQKTKESFLWENSPCSYNYVVKSTCIDSKTPRFQIGSIYYRDEVNKQKKVFNEFQKPDLLLHEFRRQIEEASHPKYNTASKKNKQMTEKQKYRAKSVSMSRASHLYEIPPQTAYTYDFHGCRTSQIGEYNVKQIQNRIKQKKRNFSFGRRMDLSRPLNFYPGPGTYDKLIPLTQRLPRFSRTCVQFGKKKSQQQNPQTERYTHRQGPNLEDK